MRLLGSSSDGPSGQIQYADLLGLGDDKVMQELQAGNADAFAVIFKRYHRLVHVTALQILRDAGEAEDLTQGVFLEVYAKAAQFDPARGTLKVWLLQFAYSRSISRRNYLMVRKFHNQTDLEVVEQDQTLWSPVRLMNQETVQLSREVLGLLPEEQRSTIEMFFFEGLTFKEIAQRRNEKFSNVRHHYYRGLERIRDHIAADARRPRTRPSSLPLGDIQGAES